MKTDKPHKTIDRQILADIYAEYAPRVHNLARHLLGDSGEADDVVQDVFLSLWEQRDTLTQIRSMNDYLFRMTRNSIFNMLKHRRIVELYAMARRQEETETTDNEDNSDELIRHLHEAIEQMPPQRRKVFTMSHRDSMSYKEIAGKLNISQATVHYHISRALEDLRKNLSRYMYTIF